MEKSAIISECGLYRYELRRIWQTKTGLVCWVMINPHRADANIDDPVIRLCMGYTARWGYGGIIVVNLFALRAKTPRELYKVDDPIGPTNDEHIIKANAEAVLTIAAWGNHGSYLGRDKIVMPFLTDPHYLVLNKNGSPHHPLYLRKELKPIPL